ncbi:MAG: TldD/PmbA family protein [Oligoflexus sp.]
MKPSAAAKLLGYLKKELQRSLQHLKAPGHPRPYYISYLFRETQSFVVWGRYGAIFHQQKDCKRQCYADVRVGSYRFDHVTKGGLSDNSEESESYELTEMPLDDHEDGLRFALWRLTDAKYREAVARYHGRKSRNVSFLDENRGLPSFCRAKAEKTVIPIRNFKVDEKYWLQFIKKASLVFRPYMKIKNSYCEVSMQLVTKIFVSSEGVERAWQEPVYSVSAYMWFHTNKANQDLSIVHHVVNPGELPDLASFKREIKQKIDLIYAMEQGDEMSSYNGPVLMAPRPAGLFLHEVMGHRLEGSRLLSDSEGRTFKDKIQQKIMHSDLSIYDDPRMKSFAGQTLVGHYPFDDEGSPAKRAVLVEKGVLKGFLTTRSPLKKTGHQTNGHARNHSHERPISRMANLVIESHSQHTWQDLKRMLVEEVKRRKLKYGIILVDVEGGETETEAYDFQAFMGEITVAIKVYPNGKEKYVRGVDFVGTPLGSLSNILAVGKDYEVDNGFCGAESGTVPVSTVSPALLLSNLELQVKDPSKVTQYALPLPWAKIKTKER